MKVANAIRQQRKKDIALIYQTVLEYEDEIAELLEKSINRIYKQYNIQIQEHPDWSYKELLSIKDYNKFVNELIIIIEDGLSNIISYILSQLRQIYKSFNPLKRLILNDLLYDEDGLTLIERIQKHLDNTKISKNLCLLSKLILIVDTEAMRCIILIVIMKLFFINLVI